MKVIEAKVVILGCQGVGKTSFIMRYTGKAYNKLISPTIGASFFSCSTDIDEFRIRLCIWDTAGQERFRAMAPMYYRNANAAFLVFDITSYESFMGMKSWLEELRRSIDSFVYLCIVGNKRDLDAISSSSRQVKVEEANEYAEMVGASYVETSALTNEGVEEAFMTMSNGIIGLVNNGSDTNLKVLDTNASPPSSPSPIVLDKPPLPPVPPEEYVRDHSSCC